MSTTEPRLPRPAPSSAPRRAGPDLRRLNAPQREAVLHGEGPLLMLAGAGSGKTTTMAYRIAHLVSARGVRAENVLGLSFTNKAAKELKARVTKLVTQVSGAQAAKGLTLSTFHSLCVRLLRSHGKAIGVPPEFTIASDSDQQDIVRQILRNIQVDERKFDASWILFQIGQAKNRFLSPVETIAHLESLSWPTKASDEYAAVATSVYPRYQEQLRSLQAMDFDDLLYNAVKLLETDAEARDFFNRRFRHVLVDEYQDTNPSQFRLLRALTQHSQNVCVVGDDDQSIYAWRGADPTHILEFGEHYPGARVITLDQNYRSTGVILEAANAVIQNNRQRHAKTLWSDRERGASIREWVLEDDRAEAEAVAEEIDQLCRVREAGTIRQARPWSDVAVLYRSNPQSRVFEEALRMRQIPYKIVGSMSFLDRKEIKDLLSYWRLAVNPRDDASFRRVANWPTRGVSRNALETISTRAMSSGFPLMDAAVADESVSAKARAGLQEFVRLARGLRAELQSLPATPQALSVWGKRSLERIDAARGLAEDYDDPAQAAQRMENLEEMVQALGQLNPASFAEDGAEAPRDALALLREYLTRLLLQAQEEEEDSEDGKHRDEVTLLTLHGAKGLEFPVVFLVGLEDGLLPHRRVIEDPSGDLSEERRLCYVGITRAKDQLVLTRARTRIRYGKPVPRHPSRFLPEIPAELLEKDDRSAEPDLSSKEVREKHEARVTGFLASIRGKLGG
ncbi:MAG: UvrD-helicase domain-containing protein [Bdellovibrionales bacterium]|nr:UvrD-helicase domain-containing protein [Bdellovibrionales bacterium]